MKRKAQGLSLNTIVIAVLVIIVLLALIAVFTGTLTGTRNQTAETRTCAEEGLGGVCVPLADKTKCQEHYGESGTLTDAQEAYANSIGFYGDNIKRLQFKTRSGGYEDCLSTAYGCCYIEQN